MDALIGYTGFVGSNLAEQHHFDCLYNSRNIGDIRGRNFDLLVFAGAQAKKWWANLHPVEDWDGIQSALACLESVTSRRVVLISTVDVLPSVLGADEDYPCGGAANHAYGTNRLRLEQRMRDMFSETAMIRLPGLFGPRLAKNVIFDLLHGNGLELINPESAFQYYDLRLLWSDCTRVLAHGIPLAHFATEPVKTAVILERFFPHVNAGSSPNPAARYDMHTKYATLFGGRSPYMQTAEQVLDRLGDYISTERRGKAR